jgi:PilZ domain
MTDFSQQNQSQKNQSPERRRFSRILFDAHVELAQGDYHWRASLLDISLKGLLLQQKLPENINHREPILVKVLLTDNTTIAMSVMVAHQHHNQLGLSCESIDIDSISHLRRLIELNLGDTDAAERELSELVSDL